MLSEIGRPSDKLTERVSLTEPNISKLKSPVTIISDMPVSKARSNTPSIFVL